MAWLPLQEFAEVKQCSTRTIRRQIQRGQITSKKMANGRRMIWLSEEVHTVTSPRPPVSREQYMVPLFEIYEGLCTLRSRFEGPLQMGEWLENCGISQGNAAASYESCAFFFKHLDQCFQQIDQLILKNRLDPLIIKDLYRTLVILRSHWQEAALYSQEERGDQVTVKTKTLDIFDHLISQVRNLILMSIKNTDAESVSHVMSCQRNLVATETQLMPTMPQESSSVPQTDTVILQVPDKEETPVSSKKKSQSSRNSSE